jgi:nucleotidyltransferase/DNA polymerase involved in DNA repair
MMISSCFVLLLTLCFGQDETKLPADFSTLQKVSLEELDLKTQAHNEAWGLGKIARWELNQDTGELVFSFADGMKAVCPAQIIGTYNSKDHTWLWAWANPSTDEKLRTDALKVRKYGEEHHIDRLTKSKWVGTEDDAWAMTALAVKLCGEQGAYRGPAGSTYVFIAFGQVTLSKSAGAR